MARVAVRGGLVVGAGLQHRQHVHARRKRRGFNHGIQPGCCALRVPVDRGSRLAGIGRGSKHRHTRDGRAQGHHRAPPPPPRCARVLTPRSRMPSRTIHAVPTLPWRTEGGGKPALHRPTQQQRQTSNSETAPAPQVHGTPPSWPRAMGAAMVAAGSRPTRELEYAELRFVLRRQRKTSANTHGAVVVLSTYQCRGRGELGCGVSSAALVFSGSIARASKEKAHDGHQPTGLTHELHTFSVGLAQGFARLMIVIWA